MNKEYLQLEPIGFVFLIFFAILLIVQFIGMLFHRFGTFSQILSTTYINWTWYKNNVCVTKSVIFCIQSRNGKEYQTRQI